LDWSFARIIAPVVTTPPSPLAPIKSRIVTFWNWLTQIHVEELPLKPTERAIMTVAEIFS